MRVKLTLLACGVALALSSSVVQAQDAHPSTHADLQQRFDHLMQAEPNNLDAFFSLANHAAATQDLELSARALEYMLNKDRALSRVKLDLGLIYIKQNKPEPAKKLFEEVLASNPPEPVQKNIQQAMVAIEKMEQKHVITGNTTLGFNYDSNANSASSSGSVIFNDVPIPLEDSSAKAKDGQAFLAAGANHTYRFENGKTQWQNGVNLYRTEQVSLDQLDLGVLALRTGLNHALDEKKSLNSAISYSYIELDGFEYLNVTSLESGMDFAATQQLMFMPRLTFEYREFVNSPFATTFTERSGNAYQAKLDARYILNDKNMLNAGAALRLESTKRDYYDNWQLMLNAGHTYLFTPETFLNTGLSYRFSDYEGLDSFVSSSRIREDHERGLNLTLGHSFIPGLVGTLGYQYRKVTSNIQNYDYDNHRVGATLTKQFE